MPVLPTPDYRPPLPFRSGNLATIYPPLFRLTPLTAPDPERIELADSDFLDMDWHRSRTGETNRLAVISHGLEGHSRKKYVLGMACMATNAGMDAACWTQRGCSGEPNRLPFTYHSGVTDDLHEVVMHCLSTGRYDEVVLIGFSLGGNQTLKYLGETPERVPPQVKAAMAFSTPCDLSSSERAISRPSHMIYVEYFMRTLRTKIRDMERRFPGQVDASRLKGIRTLRDFDNRYTAPMGGFRDAADYYARASCLPFLDNIRIPTLLVNALDDPFMGRPCYPVQAAEANPHLFLEMPRHGGHVGFVSGGEGNIYWSEDRARIFLSELAA